MRKIILSALGMLLLCTTAAAAQGTPNSIKVKFSNAIPNPQAMADFDRDGNVDILSIETGAGGELYAQVYFNNGANDFSLVQSIRLQSGVLSGIEVKPKRSRKTPYEVLLNLTTAAKTVGYKFTVGKAGLFKVPKKPKRQNKIRGTAFLFSPGHTTQNDIDGDGLPETLQLEETANGPVLRVDSSRGGAPSRYLLAIPQVFGSLPYGSAELGLVAAADLELDGDIDLIALVNFRSSTITGPGIPPNYWRLFHLRNDGTATFPTIVYKDLPGDIVSTVLGGNPGPVISDLNGDGRPELLLSNFSNPAFVPRNSSGFSGFLVTESVTVEGFEGTYSARNIALDPGSDTRCASPQLSFDFIVRAVAGGQYETNAPSGGTLSGQGSGPDSFAASRGSSSGRFFLREIVELTNIDADSADLHYSYAYGSSIGDPFVQNCSYSYSGTVIRQ